MPILLTAFEPYDNWRTNSSWLTLVELLKQCSPGCELITRRYPVDLTELEKKLDEDLRRPLDAVLHLGQAPGSGSIRLEAVALNAAGCIDESGEELPCLIKGAPIAYRTQMPVGRWCDLLRNEEIPAKVSYHAGTYLCNATMFLSHHWFQSRGQPHAVGFVHLPLTPEQVATSNNSMPSLPVEMMARGIRLMLDDLVQWLGCPESENVA